MKPASADNHHLSPPAAAGPRSCRTLKGSFPVSEERGEGGDCPGDSEPGPRGGSRFLRAVPGRTTMSGTWRTVRVFLSSTFRDMHAERGNLVKVVFPALRERLLPSRLELLDIDLRCGVTREQAESEQVIT